MAQVQLTNAAPAVQHPRPYEGPERRGIGETRPGAAKTRLRLCLLVLVASTAVILAAFDVHLPAERAGELPALLVGLTLAAATFHRFRYALLRDVFSLEVGSAIVSCGLMMGAALVLADDGSSFAGPLAVGAAAATIAVTRTLRRPVVNSGLRPARSSAKMILVIATAGTCGFGLQHAARTIVGVRTSALLVAAMSMSGALAAVWVARLAIDARRDIVTSSASVCYLSSLSALIMATAEGGEVTLAVLLLLAAGSIAALEASIAEVWSGLSHEARRVLDLIALSREQQSLLDAERTAGATRRHDQKATVLAIEGAVSALASSERQLEPDQRDHLASAVRAELARLRRGLERTQSIDVQPVPLRDALTPLVVCMRGEGVNVRLDVPAGIVVDTNPDCLLEIVQNLVDNAATHGLNRGIRITGRRDAEGFELAVSDRGPGVPDALRDVIFERGVTSRAADHSGLGLFSAVQLAQRLGGALRVEAARRGGARFVLRVPSSREDPVDLR